MFRPNIGHLQVASCSLGYTNNFAVFWLIYRVLYSPIWFYKFVLFFIYNFCSKWFSLRQTFGELPSWCGPKHLYVFMRSVNYWCPMLTVIRFSHQLICRSCVSKTILCESAGVPLINCKRGNALCREQVSIPVCDTLRNLCPCAPVHWPGRVV
jgi:hypothetical protein